MSSGAVAETDHVIRISRIVGDVQNEDEEDVNVTVNEVTINTLVCIDDVHMQVSYRNIVSQAEVVAFNSYEV